MNCVRLAFYFAIIHLISCKQQPPTLFSEVQNSNINFQNNLQESKDLNVFNYRNFYNGGGVATGDLNNDGLPEVFFTANQGSNKLYLNKGNFKFEDVSLKAGFTEKKQWSTGVVFADVNADGWLDIYVCNAGNMLDSALRKNQLYINNHNLTFTEAATQYGLDNDGYTTHASFFDYDLDGDLDCMMINNSPIPVNTLNYANTRDLPASQWAVGNMLKGGGDHLYRNDNGEFVEVTKQAGLHGGLISLGLGITVADVNGDGYPDMYVSNDFFEKDYLYINQRNGAFIDELETRIQHTSLSSMGADIQDINNDGSPDIFTTDMLPSDDYRLKANTSFENYDVFKLKQDQGFHNQYTQNALQVNNGNGGFAETGFYSGVAASDWSWGALMFDADNDGLSDIFVCNGIYRDVTDQDFIDFFANDVVQQMAITGKKEELSTIINKMPSNPIPNMAFKNMGNLKFKDNGVDWGFQKPTFSNGAAYADLDLDGDLDLVISNVNDKALVYKNNGSGIFQNNFIAITLQYQHPNYFAIGSKIKIFQGKQIFSREVMPSRGFQSSVEYKQTIGLGSGMADSIIITWPNQSSVTIIKPDVNKIHSIAYTKNAQAASSTNTSVATIFVPGKKSFFDKHTEDPFVDFYYERNIPFMLSRQGPKGATGDVNGDGLEDVYIGGAKDQPAQLYLQTTTGFVKKPTPDFTTYSFNDITTALFFDADADGDLDLFAGGGGNFSDASLVSFQNLLYINDGKANFTLQRGALPILNTNCGAAAAFDYDADGKLDLFIGSRSVPQNYGITPSSVLLHNEGNGKFADVTSDVANTLEKTGLITSVNYADINGDGKGELIIAGEWMAPMVFSFNGKSFVATKTGLENYLGLWQTLNCADVDADGDLDLFLGNIGLNFYLQANNENPIKLWMKDFDLNGTVDKVFTKTVNGKDVPVFTKREITEQIPSLKKLNLKHHEYATRSVQQLFGKELETAQVKKVNYLASAIAYNTGKGVFTLKQLPLALQLSSVNKIITQDVNEDGYVDVVAAGNTLQMLPQFCTLDALHGTVLLNDKKGWFTSLSSSKSGVQVTGETRDILSFNFQNKNSLLFLVNNSVPVLYQKSFEKPGKSK